jgi:RNA polymerase sigma factor (sigma-70 family)
MVRFMYLFRSNPAGYRSMSPEQMQQTMKKWMDWKDTLEKNGHVKQFGERLDGTGKVVRGKAKAVTDGPYVEVKDFIQGYTLIEARDMDQAVELAKGCPILEGDGTVEIRPFVSMCRDFREDLYERRTGIGRPFFPPGGGENGLLLNQELRIGTPRPGRRRGPGRSLPRPGNVACSWRSRQSSAWLMRVARNRAIDLLSRDDQFRYFAPELTHLLKLREEMPGDTAAFEKEIQDDQLRMMFSCCHPELSTEAQVTLILKTLCGFSVSEIAHALLTSEDSIEKRLGRARKLFRLSGTFVELANASEIPRRLLALYQPIYLLFNEGYHGSRSEPRCLVGERESGVRGLNKPFAPRRDTPTPASIQRANLPGIRPVSSQRKTA